MGNGRPQRAEFPWQYPCGRAEKRMIGLRGCNWLACLVLAVAPVLPARADDGPFTLNLQEAELQSLIDTVARRTGRRFVVDPRVDARVTVISAVPVEDDELYEVFESVLDVHGYTTVDAGDVTMIVPAATGPQSPVPVMGEADGRRSRMVTRILEVENVSAEQVVPILEPLMGEESHLAAFAGTNNLIMTDTAGNIERLRRIVGRVDQPVERDVEMVPVEHGSAEELVDVLTSMQATGEESAVESRITADSRTNSVLIRGGEQTRIELRALVAELDEPAGHAGDTRVIRLEHGNAEDLVDIVDKAARARIGDREGEDGDAGEAEPVIEADANSNALIIGGRPELIDGLESLVRQLDIPRAQVLVEAIIAELSTDKARELGVQFATVAEDGSPAAGLTSFSDGGSNIANIAAEPESVGSGLTLGALERGSDGTDFGALLRAIASDSDNNVLSTPSLVTLDNQEAELLVGQNVPLVTGRFTGETVGDEGGRSPFQTIEREDVGVTLTITPQINEGDAVQLEIEQEVSSISETAQAADLVTSTRSIDTTVLVEDRQTLVLGGLIDDNVRTQREQVPLLGSLPVVGHLFRHDSTDTSERTLMVFLRPRIMRSAGTADMETGRKYSYLRAEQMRRRSQAARDAEAATLPVLPRLDLRSGAQGNNTESTGGFGRSDGR